MATASNELHVRAFARGLSVIEAMGDGVARHSISTVAARAGLPRSVARRLLLTLVDAGYARCAEGQFWLTPRVLRLGLSYLYTLPFWKQAQRALEELRQEVGESCSMAVLDGEDIVYVLRIPSRRILAMNLSVGSRLPAHAISLGRVLLAGLDNAALAHYLQTANLRAFTPKTVTAPTKLRKILDAVREQGYAWVDGELDEAICGIAVPVRDEQGNVVAAINVSLNTGEFSEENAKHRFLAPLRRAASLTRSPMLDAHGARTSTAASRRRR
jgi:IclR family pca regulon transcriptional regulator